MSGFKGTPGPWKVSDEFSGCDNPLIAIVGKTSSGDRVEICDLWQEENRGCQDENARLIAAAPDLLEALECMIIGACAVAVPHNGERAVLQDAVNIARAAIAKATGE